VEFLARLLTPLYITEQRMRRAIGLGLSASCASALSPMLAAYLGSSLAIPAGGLAVLLLAVCLVQLSNALRLSRQQSTERALITALGVGLPRDWYILADLEVLDSAGEPVHVWATVVAPGGIVIIQICTEGGHIYPSGAVWVVGQRKNSRMIPSPATRAHVAGDSLRACLGDDVQILPVVALIEPNGVFYPSDSGAFVVGAPHLASAILQCGAGQKLSPQGVNRVASELYRLHGYR
jgi:hypothetical protein